MSNRVQLHDDDLRSMYGATAVISRNADFVFVHLDRPSASLVQQRTETFNPDEFFKCDCRVCQITREGGIVVFDDTAYADENEVAL